MSTIQRTAPAQEQFAPGLRVTIRDAEWIIKRADPTSNGFHSLLVTGISELVRGREARFLTELDYVAPSFPEDTTLKPDSSPLFADSRLYLESLLRQSPPTTADLWIGYKAAMDVMPYQLEPALQALGQIRHRILIADAVGLGKTIEVGILLAELIRRGKGKRILVVTTKSMMTQFQAELWSRFTIPLVRLDRAGIQRIRDDIPTDANPFDYYDKTIISVDTLKNENAFRTYLEKSHWDIIVVDEAHNVAVRGSRSARAKLAQLLSSRSDTMILASATPHDGKPESFASLMNMLNPTAIADSKNYTKEQVEGLFLRRFKKDVQEQIGKAFLERKTSRWAVGASAAEESAFDLVVAAQFQSFDQASHSGRLLFRTVLEKSLFSSPAACLRTIEQRVKKLEGKATPEASYDRELLASLRASVEAITPKHFSKYQELLRLLKPGGKLDWNPKQTDDRLVIFTERVETLRFLRKHLQEDLKLKPDQIAILHGQGEEGDDATLQETVLNFGRDQEPIRLLIATDVASEGINLHYLSHKLIHFDIPWSLMVFQQRNGRVDRYGQEKQPHIAYLHTNSANDKIRGDHRILEILSEKDQKAVDNIGDPSAFLGVFDQNEEELTVGKAIERGLSAAAFDRQLEETAKTVDFLSFLTPAKPATGAVAQQHKRSMPTLFQDDLTFFVEALKREDQFDFEPDPERQLVALTMPKDLQRVLKRIAPKGSLPKDDRLLLTIDRRLVQREIDEARKRKSDEQSWPQIHLLWDLHPAVEWLNYRLLVKFARREAPVVTLRDVLKKQEIIFLMQGEIPNRKGQPVVHSWFGVRYQFGQFKGIEELPEFLDRTQFHRRQFPNANLNDDVTVETTLLREAVDHARQNMSACRAAVKAEMEPKLNEARKKLAHLRGEQQMKLELDFADQTGIRLRLKESRQQTMNRTFEEHEAYVRETLTTEDSAFVRVAAVFRGD